jgi:hypothetical protein
MKTLISIKGLLIAAMLVFTTATFAQKNDAPWKSLFNGKNLDGWKMVGDKGEANVENGEIIVRRTLNTKEHTFVTTKKKYSDFILEVDFKMDAPGWSTGVLVRCIEANSNPDTSKVRLYGYQIKIDNTARNWTGGIFDDFGGTWKWMYDLSKNEPARQAFKTYDWNTFRIEAIGNNIKVWLNGVPSTDLINNKYSKGYIALKIHSVGAQSKDKDVLVHFKSIRIISRNVAKYAKSSDIKQITVN